MSKGISFYVNFHIKEEHVDSWKRAALEVLNAMSLEDTFISAYLSRDANDPTHFTLFERWSEPSMEAFMKNQLQGKAYREAYEKQLPEWTKSPRTFTQLEPLNHWHK
jgi:quinol monooxygenase YgiN